MQRLRPIKEYSAGFKFVHWFIAVLVLLMLSLSFFLDGLPKESERTGFMIHKSIGLTILFVMLIRLVWVMYTGRVPLPVNVPRWERFLSRLVQSFLYLFLILMPLSGWIMSVAANRPPSFFTLATLSLPGIPLSKPLAGFMAEVHETIAWILIGLVILHVAGALKHHFIDKDDVLRRMLRR
ncbi:cytochrome b [Legionella jordanis]|uniref:Cytochrome b-561 transmembrane protein n=1 Tax=Legionella jordanis TaxID=456 RepID=A0A0W0VAJ6_9GAMM|nr:cytochrome b [Legionella jordanis]KTD17150.1 cytochrome b-561 transmembrane protein [Legionella jordanis]RMX03274.1 cytochrome b [Legionella jordanis]RMX18252.1 cytochrome b [Legionella jordanis]VEH12652.1 cybB cytochrome b-561 transmembrane protein [Legionella jordanis]HAT8713275.1 cytochrome b [Legionella jordanis]